MRHAGILVIWMITGVILYQCAVVQVQRPGVDLYEQGKYEQAIAELRKQIKENPESPTQYYYLGLAQLQLGRLDSAIASYQRGRKYEQRTSMDSTYAALMARHASGLVDSGRYDPAMTWAKQALQLDSENRLARYERFMAEGLQLFYAGSKWKLWDAIVAFGKAIQVMPERPMPYYYTAKAYQDKNDKDFSHIIPNYEKALERDPPPNIAEEIKKQLKEQRRRKKLYEDFWGE